MTNIPEFHVRRKGDGTPVLSANEIEGHASAFLRDYENATGRYSLTEPQATPIEDIIELYCKIRLEVCALADPATLGMTTFSEGYIPVIKDGKETRERIAASVIVISSELADDAAQEGRLRFTEAHELAHQFYHHKVFCKDGGAPLLDFGLEEKRCAATACRRDDVENIFGQSGEMDWVEWQADCGASCLLMPQESVREFWKPFLKTETEFILQCDEPPLLSHMAFFKRLLKLEDFAKTYKVSKTAAKIRLSKLGYIRKEWWI